MKSIDVVWITHTLTYFRVSRAAAHCPMISFITDNGYATPSRAPCWIICHTCSPTWVDSARTVCLFTLTHTHTHSHILYTYCINTTHTIINHWYYHRSIVSIQPKGMPKVIRLKGGASFVSSIRFFYYYLVTTHPRPFVEFFFLIFQHTTIVTDAESTKDKNLKKKN